MPNDDERLQLWREFAVSAFARQLPRDLVGMLMDYLVVKDRDYRRVLNDRCIRICQGRLHVCPIAYVQTPHIELQLIARRRCNQAPRYF